MPSPRKRIGFLPSEEIQEIIEKLCRANEFSQSKVTGLLVEEALRSRGVLSESLGSYKNLKDNFINFTFEKKPFTENNKSSGNYTDMSITSFYGSHIINCAGNGGALALNNKEIYEQAKLLRSWGRSSSLFDEKSENIENRFNINLDGIESDAKFVFDVV